MLSLLDSKVERNERGTTMNNYKRLTIRLSNGKIGCLQEYSQKDLINRLSDLEDKIEDGTLIELGKPYIWLSNEAMIMKPMTNREWLNKLETVDAMIAITMKTQEFRKVVARCDHRDDLIAKYGEDIIMGMMCEWLEQEHIND